MPVTVKSVTLDPLGQNKLSAYVELGTSGTVGPISYSYTVRGKSSDVDFTFSHQANELNPKIPVIGLYAHYLNKVTLTVTLGDEAPQDFDIKIDTTGQDYGNDVVTKITIDRLDEEIAANTIDTGWFVTDWNNAYDKNGDLRMTGMFQWVNTSMKTYENTMFCGDPAYTDNYYTGRLHRTNLMGEVIATYTAPEGYGFHHDITFDGKGNLYALGTLLRGQTDDQKKEGIIYRFDLETGELLWQRDFTETFMGAKILTNGETNDIHLNTIEYIHEYDIIITNSRAMSTIFAHDPETGDILWKISNPANGILPDVPSIVPVNSEGFRYWNGEHATIYTDNPKYAEYRTDGRITLAVFDNASCHYVDGSDNLKVMEEESPFTVTEAPFESAGYVICLDIPNMTFEVLDRFTVKGQHTRFAGWLRDSCTHYYDFLMATPVNHFVIDTDGKIGVQIFLMDTSQTYRARVIQYPEIRQLLIGKA